ncbi:MAG: hypothetical protein ACRDBM_12740 [Sporomusa sp.]
MASLQLLAVITALTALKKSNKGTWKSSNRCIQKVYAKPATASLYTLKRMANRLDSVRIVERNTGLKLLSAIRKAVAFIAESQHTQSRTEYWRAIARSTIGTTRSCAGGNITSARLPACVPSAAGRRRGMGSDY